MVLHFGWAIVHFLSLTRLLHRIAHLLFYSVDCCQRSYEQMLLLECNVSLHRFCRNSIPRILSCYYYYYYFRSFDGVVFVSDVYTTNVHVVLSFSSPIETVNTKSTTMIMKHEMWQTLWDPEKDNNKTRGQHTKHTLIFLLKNTHLHLHPFPKCIHVLSLLSFLCENASNVLITRIHIHIHIGSINRE